MTGSSFRAVDGGVRVQVKVTPKAGRNGVVGVVATAEGGQVLKVSVTAVPEQGKANEAVVRLLAKEWDLPRTTITVIAGATDRNKTLLVAGEPARLIARLDAWLAGLKQ